MAVRFVTDPCRESTFDDTVAGVSDVAKQDLLWVVNSPSLFADEEPIMETVDEGLATEFEIQPSPKVGHYFEALVKTWLELVRGCEIVAHRQQVIEAGQTLGELDFVFRDEQGRLNHWEAAVKFYLFDPEQPVNGSCFIGPNTSDTLERKHQRLREHQLRLGEMLYPDLDLRRGFVKGRIYQNPFVPGTVSSAILNPDHLRGTWLRRGQLDWLDEIERGGGGEYRVLEKPHWLCAAPFESMDVNNLRVRMREHFEDSKKSIHVGISRDGVEIDRLFVVADDWPHR